MKRIHIYLALILFLAASIGFINSSFGQSSDESAADNLPLPSSLIDEHVEAMGGEAAIRAHDERTVSGTLKIQAYGIDGDINIASAAPNKLKTTVGLGQFGNSLSGYNGSVGWSMDPMSGNRVLQGDALQGMIDNADFYGNNLHLGKNAVMMKTIEKVTFNDTEHFRVVMVDADGNEQYLYFSEETGLLSGVDTMAMSATGITPTQIRMEKYKEFGGVQVAMKIISSQNGVDTVIEFDTVSYDDLTDNTFDLPEEIQNQL